MISLRKIGKFETRGKNMNLYEKLWERPKSQALAKALAPIEILAHELAIES